MHKAIRPSRRTFALYLLPGLIIYSFAVLLPIINASYFSLFSWTGGPVMRFIGLENYMDLIVDKAFWSSLSNNLIVVVLGLLFQVGVGFVFALFLRSKTIKFKGFHRTIIYFPTTLASVIVAFVWALIYDYRNGLINAVLRGIGLEHWAQSWLDIADTIMVTATIPLLWQFVGMYIIILMAGFTSISNDVLEMAEIDGATGIKKAYYITMPLLKNTIVVCMMLSIAGNMRGFEHLYIMTGGGPGDSSTVMALYAYKTSFLKYNYGYGSAISIGVTVVSLALILGIQALLQGTWRGRKES